MDDHARQVLEFGPCLEVIAGYAASEAGRETVRGLLPRRSQPDKAVIADCLTWRRQGGGLPPARVESPEDILRRVRPEGANLEIEDFLVLRRFLAIGEEVRTFLVGDDCEALTSLQELGRQIAACRALRERIDQVFDHDGRIRDQASKELAGIRRGIGRLEQNVNNRLRQMMQDADLANVFHEQFVAVRNGRYVVPVRRDRKGRVKGIVHDQSNSGHTLFIEPAVTLESGNELARLRLDERDEVCRILAALAELLRADAGDLASNAALLARYDLAYAVSAWADSYDCEFARRGRSLALVRARHPLLQRQLRQDGLEDTLAPLDLKAPRGKRVVVITGSNTGGKTVILKTIGLLALLAQCGLPVPAATESSLPFFPHVLADIGDEQSIEQSLSTFSGHVRQVTEILATSAEAEALVLLDELGAGTDPIEGGSLSCAVLETLCANDALAFATTHLGMVKSFVHQHPQMENACVLFDAETLRPEYVLEIGRPGASHALGIATRLGLPEPVVARARELMGSDEVRLEHVLATMDEKQRQLNDELHSASQAREDAGQERDEIKQELQDLRRQRRELLHQARGEAANLVENTRRQMDAILADAKRLKDGGDAKKLQQKLDQQRQKLDQGLRETGARPAKPAKPAELAVGNLVWVEVLRDKARITALSSDKKRATVDVNGVGFQVEVRELGRIEAGEEDEPKPKAEVHLAPAPRRASLELNLIGQRVDEALPQLDRFLDDALLAGLQELRVVHGFGTGALCRAVHEHLAAAEVVQSFRRGIDGKDAGGGGVTLVYL